MTGSIELDQDGRTLRIRFPYDELLVERVRGLPERRWDRADKSWKVPAKHVHEVVSTFMGFAMAPEVSSLLAGTTVPTEAPKKERRKKADPASSAPADPDAPLTVKQFNEAVRTALQEAFPRRVRVRGEIVGFEKNQNRKHLFFELVEKAAHGDSVDAKVDLALFERRAKTLVPTLRAAGLELQDGIEILVEGRVDFYPVTGRFQLIVEDIDARFTLGQLALGREEILKKLREQGLHERNRSLALPLPALRIGVLTSLSSDGFKDFEQTLRTSGYAFRVTAGDVRVQGRMLRPTMLAGLEWFAERADRFDLLVILRGGGSRTDLAWFDDEEVARAVALHPLKVLVGIGHERDESVLDVIAHSEKTPTAVAHMLLDLARMADDRLRASFERLERSVQRRRQEADQRLAELAQRFVRGTRDHLREVGGTLLDHARLLQSAVRARLAAERESLTESRTRVRAGVSAAVHAARARLDEAGRRLPRAAREVVRHRTGDLERYAGQLRLLDPARVLRRGYALVHGPAGEVVPDAAALGAGARIEVRLRDGRVAADVVETTLEPVSDPVSEPTPTSGRGQDPGHGKDHDTEPPHGSAQETAD